MRPKLRLGAPYWLSGVPTRRARPSLRRDLDVDVAVVGGGVTGCTLAYFLAQAGARVALFEAKRVGQGSTAASTALLMQEPDTDFGGLRARYGEEAARHVWRAGRAAVTDVQRTLQALHIDAAVHGLPSVYITRDAREVSRLRREQQRRRAAGLPARWLSSSAVQELTGIDAGGGILTMGNAQVDPYRASVGLADAAEAGGARIFEGSPVRRMRGDRHGVEMAVGGHRVRAAWGVVATGYATSAFKPLAGRFRLVDTYVMATPRLSRRLRTEVGLGDAMVWDTAEPYHYVRWTPDHRLLFGGADRPHRPSSRRSALASKIQELRHDLAGFYPALAGIAPAYAWEGLFAATPDGLPYIGTHRRYPRHLFALGYGGNGMTFSFLAARILTRLIEGRPHPWDDFFSFRRTAS